MAIRKNRLIFATVALLALPGAAGAWHGKGHHDATKLALRASESTDPNLPAFFVAADGLAVIAHTSLDPDNFTRPIAADALHRAEAPEHWFDVELVGADALTDASFPADRYAFIDLCHRRGLEPDRVGLAPYAVVEHTQRLTVALAEHRKYPDNPAIRAKCLVLAGLLSHYAADLCQPLHTTIHYDGMADANGKSPRTGIHARTDALLGKLLADVDTPASWPRRDPNAMAAGIRPVVLDAVLPAVLDRIRRSHALVGRMYELEKALPAIADPIPAGSAVERLTAERMRAAATLIASLYVTAWRDSAAVRLPWWYNRPYNPPQTKPPTR